MILKFFRAALLFGLLFLAKASWANSAGSEEYQLGEHVYKLTWQASKVTTEQYGRGSTKVLYSVYRDGSFIHPKTLNGGTVLGCHMTSPEQVNWQPLGEPQVGWILLLSSICGNTHSYRVLVVVPDKEEYVSAQFTAKTEPIIQQFTADEINIWSTYQEWGQTGTAGSFFVPELRQIRLAESATYLTCAPFPSDVKEWPKLPYRSFTGDFFAGLKARDSKVMRSALDRYQDIDFEWLRMQGLPGSVHDLQELVRIIDISDAAIRLLSGGEQWWMKTSDNCLVR